MLLVTFFLLLNLRYFVELLTVRTTSGLVNGIELKTPKGKKYQAFLGIPYAEPPLGKNRFKKPQGIDHWSGVRLAHNYSSRCIQFVNTEHGTGGSIIGDEDCLYLNIFSPRIPNSVEDEINKGVFYVKKPVIELDTLFFIHGGAFKHGGGDEFTPEYILEQYDVIFVSFNYRLGPFGFLSTEDGIVPGNAGLKDQVLALKWIHNNIEEFGGDIQKITIAGWSAGAASVHLHYFSPWSKGLFSQGISLSGSALCPWVITENAHSKAQTLAESFGCPTDNSKLLLACLQKLPAKDILFQVEKLFLPWYYQPFSHFGPVVEKTTKGGFLNRKPYDILMDGEVTNAKWLTGITDTEGLYPGARFINDEQLLDELNEHWNEIAPHLLYYKHTVSPDLLDNVSDSIRQFYLGNNKISKYWKEELVKMIGDRLFVLGAEQAALLQSAVAPSPVYFYKFAYRGMHSLSETFCNCSENLGVSHGDDLIYWLKSRDGKFSLTSSQDKLMMNTSVYTFNTFLWQGMPKLKPRSEWDRVVSEAFYRGSNLTFMLISSHKDFKMVSKDLANRHFWEDLPIKEFRNSNLDLQIKPKTQKPRPRTHVDEL